MRQHKYLSLLFFITFLLLFAACKAPTGGTIPRGTPDFGNGTPAAAPADTNARNRVAFVRSDQLLLSNNGRYIQITHFDFSQFPTAFWQTPRWAPDGHALAFILNAQGAGVGGGGCPGPDYHSGGLYVFDIATGQLSRVLLPTLRTAFTSEHVNLQTSPPHDYWQSVFWEDPAHLLAWYTSDGTSAGDQAAGLYRYTIQNQQLTQLLTLNELGVTSLAHMHNGQPALLSVRYSSGQLFYQVVVHEDNTQSHLAIYSHAVTTDPQPGTQIWDLGTEATWCGQNQGGEGGAYVFPGWDISTNGQRLAAQTASGALQVYEQESATTVAVFSGIPGELAGHDLLLAWGPDNQTLALSDTQNAPGQAEPNGPYTTSLTPGSLTPTPIASYSPHLGGEIAWRPDSSLFALQASTVATRGETLLQTTYGYQIGKTQGQILVNDAHELSFATS